MNRAVFILAAVNILLAGVLGAFITKPREPSSFERQRQEIELEKERESLRHSETINEIEEEQAKATLEEHKRREPLRHGFWLGLSVVVLGMMVGASLGGILWLRRRANTIYPDAHGIFPVIRGKVGNLLYYHDPNRAVSAVTIYSTVQNASRMEVSHVLSRDLTQIQAQITTQAQNVQAIRAGTSRARQEHRIPHLLTAPVVGRAEPESPVVEIIEDLDPSDVEQMLLEYRDG